MKRYSERENLIRVLNWDSPSHVSYPTPCKGISYFGAWPTDVRPSHECLEWQDIWGVTWKDTGGEVFPAAPCICPEKIDQLPVPDPHSSEIRSRLAEEVAQIDREKYFLCVNHPYFLYENGFNILGPEEFLVTLAGDEESSTRLLDKLIDFELGIAEEYVKLKPDQINTSDDYGMQDRLAVSPDMWRKYFKPRLQRVYDFYRSELGDDIIISHHSCGHVMPILEDFIELGIKILNPLQTTANDIKAAAGIINHRLVVAGGIDGQHILPEGTPEEIRKEVFYKMNLFWDHGGYLPMPEKTLGVSKENIKAMEAAIAEWSLGNVEES